jgi:small basic protein
MSPLNPDVPPTGEEIHLPGPSLQPILLAFSLTLTLLGVTLGLPIIIAGVVMSIWIIVRWIADTRRDINALPPDLHEY